MQNSSLNQLINESMKTQCSPMIGTKTFDTSFHFKGYYNQKFSEKLLQIALVTIE